MWERWLRGVPKSRIAAEFGLSRETVATLINECYAETASERKASLVRKQSAAIARMRRVQQQAWDYCDADDERERSVLERGVPGTRYQSQRSQYLRVIVDAEKEIARLEGLYEATDAGEGAVEFRILLAGEGAVAARTRALVASDDGGDAADGGDDDSDG